ncbi:MAG TPA: hypothetical protein VFG83_15995, partial [Kofleriaceae bacterium]|nr:hypothetical protein [Kofleriaceae bacterium]
MTAPGATRGRAFVWAAVAGLMVTAVVATSLWRQMPRALMTRVTSPAAPRGVLAFKVVAEDNAFSRALFRHVHDDPNAAAHGIRAEPEQWVHQESGARFRDYFISAPSRVELSRYVAEAEKNDPGLIPGPGLEVAFGPMPSGDIDRRRWRTYCLVAEAKVDGGDVVEAHVIMDPVTGRPQTLLMFNRQGARDFGDLTAANVGRHLAIVIDGTVRSAPIVEAAIRGGRVTISGSSGPIDEQRAEAVALVEALGGPGAPALYDASPARRWGFGLAVGAMAFGLVFFALSLTAPAPVVGKRAAVGGGGGERLGLRVGVTIAAVVAVWLSHWLRLPYLDHEVLKMLGGGPEVSVFALGLGPVITAFVLVELVALAVPPWQRLRIGGPTGRAKLARAIAVVAIALALVQGWIVAEWLASVGGPGRGMALLIQAGTAPFLIIAVTLAAGTMAYVVLASLIDRFGWGNGYAVIILTGIGLRAVAWSAEADAGQVALIVAVIVATVWMLRARVRSSAGAGRLRLPTCGIVPLYVATAAITWPVAIAGAFGWTLLWDPAAALSVHRVVEVALVIAASVVLSWLFSGTRQDRSGTRVVRDGRGVWLLGRSTVVSCGYNVLLCLVGFVAVDRGIALDLLVSAVWAAAIAMDLVAEARARWRAPDLIAVWPLHRVQKVDDALDALAAAG